MYGEVLADASDQILYYCLLFGGLRWWQAVEQEALLFAPEQVAGYVRPDVVAPYAVAQHFVWAGIALGVFFGHG